MKKDKQDEAQRHAKRNFVIREVRNQLVTHFDYSYTDADIFIGYVTFLELKEGLFISQKKSRSAKY